MIPAEAVEAARRAYRHEFPYDENEGYVVQLILEAAAPILLSHEREQTRLTHLDAMVNRGTASRLEQAITGVLELAAPQRHMVSAAEIREWIARALEPTE